MDLATTNLQRSYTPQTSWLLLTGSLLPERGPTQSHGIQLLTQTPSSQATFSCML